MGNQPCVSGLSVPARATTTVPCTAIAWVLTLKSTEPLSICDVALAGTALSLAPSSQSPPNFILSQNGEYLTDGSNPTAGTTLGEGGGTLVAPGASSGMNFSFYVTGISLADLTSSKGAAVCSALQLVVVSKLGQQPLQACAIVSATAPSASQRRRSLAAADVLLVVAALQTNQTSVVEAALQQAQRDGALATALANIGLSLVSDPAAFSGRGGAASAASPRSSSGGSSIVAAAVGGTLGGLALVGLLATVAWLARRHRLRCMATAALEAKVDAESGLPDPAAPVHQHSSGKARVRMRHRT